MNTVEQYFEFLDPGQLLDEELELVLVRRMTADKPRGYHPAYLFEMHIYGSYTSVGAIDLRIGNSENLLLYGGHIGYRVDLHYRGHRYAARSCRLLFPLAKVHGLNPLWITCNPDNYASRKTCEYAGGTLVEIVDLPPDSDQYARGDRQKCRYRFDL